MTRISNKHRLVHLGAAVLALLVVPIAVLWAWNLVAPPLFGTLRMDYANALGIVVLAALGSWLFGGLARGVRRGGEHHYGGRP